MPDGSNGDELIGRVLDGRYAIEAKLGEGGLGAVYRATQTRLGRPVAVKVLHAEHAEKKALRDRFEREARSLGTLVHPNIVQVIDYGIDGSAPYLVMELLEGRPLDAAIRAGLEPERAIAIARAVFSAVAYAHGRGLVHRDLKPGNVFLQRLPDGGELPRVLDFGLVKFLDDSSEGAALTRAGAIMGTPAYMSPEQAAGAKVDVRADVYSLGIVLFELLTGRRPFQGPAAELLRMHLLEDLPSLESVRPGLPKAAELEAVLRRATAKMAASRYADAGELLAALDAALGIKASPSSGEIPLLGVAAAPAAAPAPAVDDVSTAATMLAPGGRAPAIDDASTAATMLAPGAPARSESAPPPTVVATPASARGAAAPRAASERTVVSSDRAGARDAANKGRLVFGAALVVGLLVVGGALALPGSDAPADGAEDAPAGPEVAAPVTTPATAAPEVAAPARGSAPAATPSAANVVTPSARATAGPLPPELEAIRRDHRAGTMLSRRDRRTIFRWSRANPGDARGYLLMAHLDFLAGARTDSLRFYRDAIAIDPAAQRDPTMRRDVVIMAGHGTVGANAAELVRELWGREAIPEIDAVIRDVELRADEVRRLGALRLSLEQGGR